MVYIPQLAAVFTAVSWSHPENMRWNTLPEREGRISSNNGREKTKEAISLHGENFQIILSRNPPDHPDRSERFISTESKKN